MDSGAPLLTPEMLAEWLGVTVAILANWRYMGKGPRFIKMGAKSIRYRPGDVDEWLRENTRQQT